MMIIFGLNMKLFHDGINKIGGGIFFEIEIFVYVFMSISSTVGVPDRLHVNKKKKTCFSIIIFILFYKNIR